MVVRAEVAKNFGPEMRAETPARPLGPAGTSLCNSVSTASQCGFDHRDRRTTVPHSPATANCGAGIRKGTKAGPTGLLTATAWAGAAAVALAFGLALPFALAFAFATPFTRLSSSTPFWSKCANGQPSPFLHSPFRKNRQ